MSSFGPTGQHGTDEVYCGARVSLERFIGDGTNLNFLTQNLAQNNFGLLHQNRPDLDQPIVVTNVS